MSTSVALSVITPMQGAEYVTFSVVTTTELVVTEGEVPVPVTEQVADPNAVNAPAGNVSVQATCDPDITPASVPPILAAPDVKLNAPVGLVPLCVAIQVAGDGVSLPPVATRVPAQVPAKLICVGAVGDAKVEPEPHPDAKRAATNSVNAESRVVLRNVILCSA